MSYQACSIKDLAQATSLTAGSLYKAFGHKKGLFMAALEYYVMQRRNALQKYLDCHGCLMVISLTEMATFDDDMKAHIVACIAHQETELVHLVEQGQRDGSIASHHMPSIVALNLMALLQGYRVMGKQGRSLEEMYAAANNAVLLLRFYGKEQFALVGKGFPPNKADQDGEDNDIDTNRSHASGRFHIVRFLSFI